MAGPDGVRAPWIAAPRAREGGTGAATDGTVHLQLLGGFGMRAGSRPVELPPRAQEILALLALRSSLDRSQLAGTIWHARTEEHALGSLRTGLWRLNQQVPGCIVCHGRRIRLARTTIVDVDDFVRRGRELLDPGITLRIEDIPDPWEIGDLLPDWEHEWLSIDRERLRQLRLHVCETAAVRLCELGQHALALEYALGVVRAEPTRESAYRTLIAVHLAEGNLSEARRTFATCVDVMRREFGTTPTFSIAITDGTAPPSVAPGRGTPRWAPLPAPDERGRGSW